MLFVKSCSDTRKRCVFWMIWLIQIIQLNPNNYICGICGYTQKRDLSNTESVKVKIRISRKSFQGI